VPLIEVEFRESRFPSGFICPHCGEKKVVRYGRERTGIQRYRCKNCRRTFNDRSVTPMARTQKPAKWEEFAHCMRDGLSCRKAAKRVGVHYQTTFAWRHKILKALEQGRAVTLGGIVEANEMSFRRSWKGSTPVGRRSHKRGGRDRNGRPRGQGKDKAFVLVARDRRGQTVPLVLDAVTKEVLFERLVPVVHPSDFCTDGSAALRAG
jgi:transposase-like protein